MKNLISKLYLHKENQWYSLQDDEGNTKVQKLNGQNLCLTDSILEDHLVGNITICLQPIQVGSNKTKYGVIDVDSDDTTSEGINKAYNIAVGIVKKAKANSIPAYLGFSGRRGWHVYVFSKMPLPAGLMRKALQAICKQAGYKAKEIYPSSDYISDTYYPRPIKLTPGKHKLGGWAGFVFNEKIVWENGKPRLPHQLHFLKQIRQANTDKLIELSRQIEEDTSFEPVLVKVDWDQLTHDHPPCISHLVNNGAPFSLNYNYANMTIVRYGLNRNLSEFDIKNLGQRMARASSDHPTTKDTFDKKMHNLMSTLWSMRKRPFKSQWNCSYVRSDSALRPLCVSCALNTKKAGVANQEKFLETTPPNDVRISQASGKPFLATPAFIYYDKLKQAEVILYGLLNHSFVGVDISCNNQGQGLLVCISTHEGEVYLFDVPKLGGFEIFQNLMNSTSVIKLIFNSKESLKELYRHGIQVENIMDVLLLGQILTAGEEKILTELNEFVELYLGCTFPDLDSLKPEDFIATKTQVLIPLGKILYEKILAANLQDIAMLECTCVKVLARMEMNGIKIADKRLTLISSEIHSKIKTLRDRLQSELSYDNQLVDLNSPDNIKTALTKKGLALTNTKKETLQALADKHGFIKDIIEYRSLKTMHNTYSTGLLRFINKDTGRIHTHFKQVVTSTGRITSEEPCTQNWPKSGFREMIIADKGRFLVAADYRQIQMVILAEFSQDQKLLDIFRSFKDVHIVTASSLLGIPESEVTLEMRQKIKAINYGLVFDMRDNGLVQYAKSNYGVEMTLSEARDFRKGYFDLFKGVQKWRDNIKKEGLSKRETRTLANRRRLFTTRKYSVITDQPEIVIKLLSKYCINHDTVSGKLVFGVPEFYASKMEAILTSSSLPYEWEFVIPRDSRLYNSPIQGTEGDILKLALIKVERAIGPLNAFIANQVYDEILVESPKGPVKQVAQLIEQEMIRAAETYIKTVPVGVETKIGLTWAMK